VFIDAVLNDGEVPIHGDGLQTRSFTYVSDTVEGIYAAIVTAEANGEIFNIGSTHEITILDLAKTIKRLCNTPGELKLRFTPYESFTGKSYEDVRRRVPDVTRCERILGVKATVGLEEGLARTIDWQRTVPRHDPASARREPSTPCESPSLAAASRECRSRIVSLTVGTPSPCSSVTLMLEVRPCITTTAH